MRTIPFNTATPNKAIKPIPAEILKGICRIHKAATPPIAASGMAVKINNACFIELKVKKSRMKIKINAMGTAISNLSFAF